MLIRIVKMTFQPVHTGDFLQVFEANQHKITTFKGCNGVQLLRDINTPSVFFTYSTWESEEDLNQYRNSALFNKVWSTVKVWFAGKPEAWSVVAVKQTDGKV